MRTLLSLLLLASSLFSFAQSPVFGIASTDHGQQKWLVKYNTPFYNVDTVGAVPQGVYFVGVGCYNPLNNTYITLDDGDLIALDCQTAAEVHRAERTLGMSDLELDASTGLVYGVVRDMAGDTWLHAVDLPNDTSWVVGQVPNTELLYYFATTFDAAGGYYIATTSTAVVFIRISDASVAVSIPWSSAPYDLVFDPVTGHAFGLGDVQGNTHLLEIDPDNAQVIDRGFLGIGPWLLGSSTFDPDLRRMYVRKGSQLCYINVDNATWEGSTSTGTAQGFACAHNVCPPIAVSGEVTIGGSVASSALVTLLLQNATGGFDPVATQPLSAAGAFLFSNVQQGNYTVQVQPDPAAYPNALPTWFGNVPAQAFASEATAGPCNNPLLEIELLETAPPQSIGGPGMVEALAFPNPVASDGVVTITVAEDNSQLAVYDVRGNVVLATNGISAGLHAMQAQKPLAPGVYLLQVTSPTTVRTQRLLVTHQ